MESFVLNNNPYNFTWYKDFTPELLPPARIYKKSKYFDVGSGFDIETTNFEMNESHYATMYCWQWSFDDLTVIGRTWTEFKEFLQQIKDYFRNDEGIKLLVYVHNLPFETSFIRKHLNIDKFLTKTKRDIMFFDSDCLEFRDSAILTRMSLAKMAEKYKLGLQKLKGDLDYSLPRFSASDGSYSTPLTQEEIAYCINDVQILQRFFHRYIKTEFLRNGFKIPLTQTGIPRQDIRRALKKSGKEKSQKWRDTVKRCMPDEDFYKLMRRYLFRGGYTHANNLVINELQIGTEEEDFGGFDRKSSYPAQIFHEKAPMQYFAQPPEWLYLHAKEDVSFWKEWGFIAAIRFTNIRSKYPHSIESKHKLVDWSEDAVFDNGRLLKASWIYVVLNEWDYLIYKNFYEWDGKAKVKWVKVSKKEWLPDFIIKSTYKYFKDKETQPKNTIFYARSKEKLNAVYGMMNTGIVQTDYIFYNGQFLNPADPEELEEIPEELRKPPKTWEEATKNLFLIPQQGINVASSARYELLRMFYIAPYDSLYGDTDSVKLRNYKKYLPAIEKYNEEMEQLNREAAERWNLDFNIIKDLGKFIWEGDYAKFKALGAKRYLYETIPSDPKEEPHIEAVVAGMEKGSFLHYCKYEKDEKTGEIKERKKPLDPFEEFKDSLYLSPEFSNKLTTAYKDDAFSADLTDYKGVKVHIEEESCCALYQIPFSMYMDADFVALVTLLARKKEREREFYKGVL